MYRFFTEHVPAELRSRQQWVLWASVEGKKVPRQARNPQRNASTTKPATWAGLDTAQAAAAVSGLGMGFVFSHADPLVFIDLDWDGQPSELQSRIIAKLDSYTEVSPSGAGVHIFITADKNRIGRAVKIDALGVEIYLSGRYSTITGDIAAYGEQPIAERTEALLEVISWLKVPEGQRNNTLIAAAGKMRHEGMGRKEIAASLAQANVELCDPPLPSGQVAEMAGYAGGYDVAGFVMIPRQMLLSHAFAALSYSAVALLLDIAARYTGTNNGRITVPFVAMQERGWKSPVTLNKVLRELRASGFLKLTKKGGSHRPSWYALPWANHTTTTTTLTSTSNTVIEQNSVQKMNRSGGDGNA
jgi:hypothetical protein